MNAVIRRVDGRTFKAAVSLAIVVGIVAGVFSSTRWASAASLVQTATGHDAAAKR